MVVCGKEREKYERSKGARIENEQKSERNQKDPRRNSVKEEE